jgi:hypothetical protein
VFNFCRQAPHVQVRNLQRFNLCVNANLALFPHYVARLNYITRNEKTWLDIFISQPWRSQFHDRTQALNLIPVDQTSAGATPSNFRLILPVHLMTIGSQVKLLSEFRRNSLESSFFGNVLPNVVGGIDRWVEIAEDMLRNGV